MTTSSFKKYKLVINGEEVYQDCGYINSIIVVWEDDQGQKSKLSFED